MIGTAKQIQWATTIKATFMAKLSHLQTAINQYRDSFSPEQLAENYSAEEIVKLQDRFARNERFITDNAGFILSVIGWLEQNDNATFWIDNRNLTPLGLISKAMNGNPNTQKLFGSIVKSELDECLQRINIFLTELIRSANMREQLARSRK